MASSSAQQPIPPTQTQQPQTTTSSSNASTAAASIDGILCNDPSGLCLMSKGTMKDNEDSGAYTSLARLASQLSFWDGWLTLRSGIGTYPRIFRLAGPDFSIPARGVNSWFNMTWFTGCPIKFGDGPMELLHPLNHNFFINFFDFAHDSTDLRWFNGFLTWFTGSLRVF